VLPHPPSRSFASDNAAGIHPDVLQAIADANVGHALAYGDDDWTRAAEAAFADLFGADTVTLLTLNGTGSNILALSTLLRPVEAVVCAAGSHINVDETGAAERILGAKLIDVPCPDGKLVPEQLDELTWMIGDVHHVQPGVLSITQSTELGTVYTPDEVAALCATAHDLGMRVHLDGARLANATAALGGDRSVLRSFTVDAGVDVLTFGGTKNGLLGAEAVVFVDPAYAERAAFHRKQVNQLASKMRFVAAQFLALLHDDLWLDLAARANQSAQALYLATADIAGVVHDAPPEVNSLFPRLPPAVIDPLREWSFFWDWDASVHQVRWMTAWDTTGDDIDCFSRGIRHYLERSGPDN
jgi:threonine aldolase